MTRSNLILLTASAGIGLAACGKADVEVYRAAKESPASTPALPGMSEAPPPVQETEELRWKLPSGWKQMLGSGMRHATLVVPGKGTPDAEMSVVVLAGAAGGELPNINRWRGQIGLDSLDGPGLARASQRVKTLAGMLLLVQYDGSQDGDKVRLLGAILNSGDKTWFFKSIGNPATLNSARPAFDEFIKSLRPPRA